MLIRFTPPGSSYQPRIIPSVLNAPILDGMRIHDILCKPYWREQDIQFFVANIDKIEASLKKLESNPGQSLSQKDIQFLRETFENLKKLTNDIKAQFPTQEGTGHCKPFRLIEDYFSENLQSQRRTELVPKASSFQKIPNPLLWVFLLFLQNHEIFGVQRVCKKWKEAGKHVLGDENSPDIPDRILARTRFVYIKQRDAVLDLGYSVHSFYGKFNRKLTIVSETEKISPGLSLFAQKRKAKLKAKETERQRSESLEWSRNNLREWDRIHLSKSGGQ